LQEMEKVEQVARAKLNLILEVLFRRPDGYHELRTVMQELALHDQITLWNLPSSHRIELVCEAEGVPRDATNLAVQAAALLQRTYTPGRGVRIHLVKAIPVAAGLGGGSSDAAAVLQGLNTLWGLRLEQRTLGELAAQLGSDVPFFLQGGTALAEGRGEKITPLNPFPPCGVLLAAPAGATLAAGQVYSRLCLETLPPHGRTDAFLRLLHSPSPRGPEWFQALGKLLVNHLEKAVFTLNPDVALLKETLRCSGLTAQVSGSGPTVFAVAADRGMLEPAAGELQERGYRVFLTETHQEKEPEKGGEHP